ncbi:methyltransferase domain-containing protein [Myxococcota bacterium]|nr:methyltransferase domain-containing protein [Myxococcota bacterium]
MNAPVLPAHIPQHEIPGVYARIAPIYDVWAHLTERKARDACLTAAAVRDGEHVLEVAVGTGLAFRELVRRNPSGRTVGIDLTEAMLERARSKVAGLPGDHALCVGDATNLDLPDASFDVVVNNYMFDLLPEERFDHVVAELRRVLRPGGRVVLVNMTRGESVHTRLWEQVYRLSPALLGGCRGVELAPVVSRAGFRDVRRSYLTQLGFPSELITAVR